MRFAFFSIVLLSLLFTSCQYMGGERITGNGQIVTRQRTAESFNSVEVSGGIKVHVRQQPTNEVSIETDENLMEFIDVFTDRGTLVIKEKSGYNLNPSKELTVFVAAPVFESIEVNGACDIIGEGTVSGNQPLKMRVSGSGDIVMQVHLPAVSAHISGSGNVQLAGKATNFDAHVSGSGSVKCLELETENTTLDLSGSSDAKVFANQQLNIDASGSASIEYKGAARVNQSISGSGSVKKIG